MVCAFCGEKFSGKPIKQGGQVYCSIECADMAAEVVAEDEEYYDEETPELDSYDGEEDEY